jgi:hypothetical protein
MELLLLLFFYAVHLIVLPNGPHNLCFVCYAIFLSNVLPLKSPLSSAEVKYE